MIEESTKALKKQGAVPARAAPDGFARASNPGLITSVRSDGQGLCPRPRPWSDRLKTAGLLVEAAALGGARRRPDVRALA